MRKGNSASNLESLFGAKRGESLSTGHRLVERATIAPDLSNPQPRSRFTNVELEGLASSIKALRERGEGTGSTGIIQSLIVRTATALDIAVWDNLIKSADCPSEYKAIIPSQISYILLAGERRWRAAAIAGQNNIPIVVTQTAAEGALLLQVIENDQRQDLSPLEKAKAYARLRDENNLSIRDVAAAIGKTRGYVTNRLDLLKMNEDVQGMVSSREDTLKHAALINPVADLNLREELIRLVIDEEASVTEVKNRIEKNLGIVSIQSEVKHADSDVNSSFTHTKRETKSDRPTAIHNLEIGNKHLLKTKQELENNPVISESDEKTLKQLLENVENTLREIRRCFEQK